MSSKHILIVEDDAEIAAFLSVGLSAEGYSVLVEPDGVKLFDRLHEGISRSVSSTGCCPTQKASICVAVCAQPAMAHSC